MEDPRNAEHDFGLVKIGITKGEVLHRAATLQTGNPYDLLRFDSFETPWPREVESFMHRTHATKMQKLEWLQCSRRDLAELVNEARRAAQQINERKSKEQGCNVSVSNGRARRASSAEFQLHRNVRRLMKEFVPEKLRLITAKNRLKAATGTTNGIPGIVRVKVAAASTRFDEVAAESKLAELRLEFPDLAAQCLTEKIRGAFRWRGVTRASDFPTECHAARLSEASANASEANVVQKGTTLEGWTDRSADMERWHDDYLEAMRKVYRLEGELSDLRTDLILLLEECDAIDRVCSFIRRPVLKIDRSAFCRNFPEEFRECERPNAPRLNKRVYPARSYFVGEKIRD
jgi:hypothetical protein